MEIFTSTSDRPGIKDELTGNYWVKGPQSSITRGPFSLRGGRASQQQDGRFFAPTIHETRVIASNTRTGLQEHCKLRTILDSGSDSSDLSDPPSSVESLSDDESGVLTDADKKRIVDTKISAYGFLAGGKMPTTTIEDIAPVEAQSSRASQATEDHAGFMPNAENMFMFLRGSEASGRTAVELDALLTPPDDVPDQANINSYGPPGYRTVLGHLPGSDGCPKRITRKRKRSYT